jgi:hypothetical protein
MEYTGMWQLLYVHELLELTLEPSFQHPTPKHEYYLVTKFLSYLHQVIINAYATGNCVDAQGKGSGRLYLYGSVGMAANNTTFQMKQRQQFAIDTWIYLNHFGTIPQLCL